MLADSPLSLLARVCRAVSSAATFSLAFGSVATLARTFSILSFWLDTAGRLEGGQ